MDDAVEQAGKVGVGVLCRALWALWSLRGLLAAVGVDAPAVIAGECAGGDDKSECDVLDVLIFKRGSGTRALFVFDAILRSGPRK